MRKTTKVVNLATALGALAVPAAAPEVANATNSDDEARIAEASKTNAETETKAEVKLPRGEDLMSFTVHQNSDGMMVPQHESHYSHSSHASHASSSY
ncbi:His-Xaa-Ser repeat protein HxsA2 [Mycobacterium sp. 050134]|uniref:His-Xaa-Ser repeat protein HxsA2 n=1 Tax=Mycobacterium sp. 050134 TaxID=3096111 RepID=UPI002ED77782